MVARRSNDDRAHLVDWRMAHDARVKCALKSARRIREMVTPTAKYKVGQTVRRRTRFSLEADKMTQFVVSRRLPIEHGVVTYRIRSASEGFDRVADEADLFIDGDQN